MFNVTRTMPAPTSLAKQQSYSEEDTLAALKDMFFEKCYLCEVKEPSSLNVEHFKSHKGDLLKKFDWNNLFFSCGRCNNIKSACYDDILDCSLSTNDMLRLIRHKPPYTPYQGEIVVEETRCDQQTQKTAELLRKIFNDKSTANRSITGAYLRKRVFRRCNSFIELVNVYFDEDNPQSERDSALERMRVFVGKKQEFSAFVRWLVLDDNLLSDLLNDFID